MWVGVYKGHRSRVQVWGRRGPRTPGARDSFKDEPYVSTRGFLAHPDPFPLFPLCCPPLRAQPMPGSWWAPCHWMSSSHMWPGGSQMARKGYLLLGTQGPNTHFSAVVLGTIPLESLPRAQDLGIREEGDLRKHAGRRQDPCSPGRAPRLPASAGTSAQQPGETWAGTPGTYCCAPCRRQCASQSVPRLPLQVREVASAQGPAAPRAANSVT